LLEQKVSFSFQTLGCKQIIQKHIYNSMPVFMDQVKH